MIKTKTKSLKIPELESWLWEAACAIRGPVDAPKYKDYILPLIFLKRLSDVFDDEITGLTVEYGDRATVEKVVKKDHGLVRLFIPEKARWTHINSLPSAGLGQALTTGVRSVARENPALAGVIDVVDFNSSQAGQRIVSDEQLHALVQVLGKHRLGLKDVEPDILGRAYEYLLRKFAEDGGQSAGEFYTPRMVGVLIANLLSPEPGMEIYDPACGSSGLLIKVNLNLIERFGVQKNGSKQLSPDKEPLKVFGQEVNHTTYAMSRMNCFIHDIDAEIALGDTMRRPQFLTDGKLRKFDLAVANPMWNQDFPQDVYENDALNRFSRGAPPSNTADWGWVQHMEASLKEGGRMAVVLDTGAVSRGSGTRGINRERNIRRNFVENDLVEAVILLPENLFYNTTAPGIIMLLNMKKEHKKQILLINASHLFIKGRPKNELTEEHVNQISSIYRTRNQEEGISTVIKTAEIAQNDYNLIPSRYVSLADDENAVSLEEAVQQLKVVELEGVTAENELRKVLKALGFEY